MKNLKIKISKNFFSNLKGLMFSKSLRMNEALLIKISSTSNSRISSSIHTLFVFFSIDVAWLDENFKVLDIKTNIKPFTPLIIPKKPARYILEANSNTFKDIKINQKINQKLPLTLKTS